MEHSHTERAAPAIAGSDPQNASLLGGCDTLERNKPSPQAQGVSIDMLRQSISDDIERHVSQLDAAVAMLAAGSDQGFLHGLRRGQAFWNAIESADDHETEDTQST
jgi:hypothetical protein